MSWIDEFNTAFEKSAQEKKGSKSSGGKSPKTYFTDNSLAVNKVWRDSNYAPTSSRVQSRITTKKPNSDIAPVSSRVKSRTTVNDSKKKKKWFEKGAFDDGYDFGDITKTILGTGADVLDDLGAGIAEMPEKIADAVGMIAPYYAQSQLNQAAYTTMDKTLLENAKKYDLKEEKKKAGEFVKKDLYDGKAVARSILNPVTDGVSAMIGQDYEKASVLGEKADSIVESGGQLLATAGLQLVGVPWFVTTGATSFGAEAENALNQGATHEEAIGSSSISAAAEILTEKLFGGIKFGGKAIGITDDLIQKQLARTISNKWIRGGLKLGLDMGGEGAEEWLTEDFNRFGQWLTYRSDEELKELLWSEEALDAKIDAFWGGTLLGGVSGAFNVGKSARSGVDYVSELTKNEQKVVDKVYKDRVAEAEKEGKISQYKKSKIYDDVLNQMEKGYISTDTIEEVLGGESFNSYKSAMDVQEDNDFLSEYEALGNKEGATPKDNLRYSEMTARANEILENRKNLKSQLSSQVSELVKGDRLSESYNQNYQRGQKFEADLTQYDDKQKAVIQKAVDSGVLNNTRRTHEFVDFVAKISADKGVLFDFANNAKIKETGFAVDGKTVNGYVTKDGVTLNIDSSKSLNSVVGHEITHVLEGTELYSELQTVLTKYAQSKGEYDSRRSAIESLYQGIEDADIDAELTADLVGDYLFTDSDFVKRLSTENRNVFQKIFDEIKYLCKMATAGSKEAKQLLEVKKAFEEAYRESGKAPTDTKYSVSNKNIKVESTGYGYGETFFTMSYEQDGKVVGTIEFSEFDGEPNVKMIEVDPDYRRQGIGTKLLQELQKKYPDTEINFGMSTPDGTKLLENATYSVENTEVTEKLARIEEIKQKLSEYDQGYENYFENDLEIPENYADDYNDLYDEMRELENEVRGKKTTKTFVKTDPDVQYSLSSDSEGRQLTKEQSDYFNDSKVRDENGNLKVVYHGSPADFNTFSLDYLGTNGTAEGYGFYFTDKKSIADRYSKGHEGQQNGESGKLFEVYLDIKKPLSDTEVTMTRAQFKKFLTELNNHVDEDGERLDVLSNYGDVEWEGLNKVLNYAMEVEYDGSDSDVNLVHSIINGCGDMKTVFDVLRKTTGYDGIIVNEASWGGDQTIYITFHPEQIKNVDNLNPTTDPDIRYSLSEDSKTYGNYNVYGKDIALENSTVEQKTQLSEENSTVSETEMVDAKGELDKLYDERQVLKDTIESLVDAEDFGDNFNTLCERWAEVDKKIDAYEDMISNVEGTTEDISPVPTPEPDAPYWFSEEIASIVDELSTQDTGEPRYGKQDVFVIKDYTIQRRLLKDGRWHYSIISPDGTSRFNIIEADKNAFYGDVAEKLESIMRIEYEDAFEQQKPGAFAADAPVRVVSTEDGDYLKTDKNGFEEKQKPESKKAKILTEMPPKKNGKKIEKAESINVQQETQNGVKSPVKLFEEYIVDNGFVFEKISKKTKNRELEAKWDGIRRVRSAAQHLIGEGLKYDGVKSLKSMMEQADKAGLTEDFYKYLYHYRNIDGMTLDTRFNTYNRGVFGDVSAAESQFEVDRLEKLHPEFKTWAEDVYAYNNHLRDMMVKGRLISQKTADLLAEMYPHYVPISRVGFDSALENDTNHVGVDSPLKSATGGNQDILPLFNTMAERTMSVYRAVSMNNFGLELYNTLYPGRLNQNTSLYPGSSNTGMATGELDVDQTIDGFGPREELLQSGKPGSLPTFSIFIDGERHTFDITNEMYTAMKQTNDWMSTKIPVFSDISNLRRNLITAYSPWFTLKNAIKDTQEIIINSQHPLKTYATLLEAGLQIAGKGTKYQEYVENGGEQNTYFDTRDFSFDPKKGVLDYVENTIGLKQILALNNYIEMMPRLAEYIASRSEGRSIEVSMLDAARVTTNFGAGGKFAKFLDRNGCTFLNSSIQGFTQQARNVVEAKQNGVKGFLGLAARYLVAGLPAVLLNHALWDDDEDYQALPDYITNNYYVPFKYGDGQFVRIPKGRMAAVIQNAIEQVARMSAGDDEADWNEFFKIAMENIAPNNPLTDNILAPIIQTATNTTWYGEDIIPYRLKDLPESEQFDEKTDSLSIWLGEKLDYSPKKINYLLDQYSGVLGDTFLPMMTPKAESPIDNPLLKLGAPLRDIFTTDSVLNNRVTGDFYETLEGVEAQAESEDATPEDKLKSDLLITYNVEISKLMQEQRDIQTSDLPDSEKYKRNRELKEQINALQKKGLEAINDYSINGIYAEAGDKRFNFGYDTENEKERWFEIKPKKTDGEDNWYYQQEQAITKDLGIGYSEYWNNREMYDDFYYIASGYDKESGSDDVIETARSVFGYERFAEYAKVLKTLKADKDENGESIAYSKWNKVNDYVNGLDIPNIEKKVLMKMLYPNTKKNNYEIVKYLDEREDISYGEWIKILDELKYKVDDSNYVTW